MNFEFSLNAWEDFEYLLDTDKQVADKIRVLLKDIKRSPFCRIGKTRAPEI